MTALCSHWKTCHHRTCRRFRKADHARLIAQIVWVLWPEGDRDREWTVDTIEHVADVLVEAGLRP